MIRRIIVLGRRGLVKGGNFKEVLRIFVYIGAFRGGWMEVGWGRRKGRREGERERERER